MRLGLPIILLTLASCYNQREHIWDACSYDCRQTAYCSETLALQPSPVGVVQCAKHCRDVFEANPQHISYLLDTYGYCVPLTGCDWTDCVRGNPNAIHKSLKDAEKLWLEGRR